jgi:hypothetical protein
MAELLMLVGGYVDCSIKTKFVKFEIQSINGWDISNFQK